MAWHPIQSGSVIGSPSDPVRYEVLESLGQGAFGQVFKVKDVKLGTVCALKTVHERYQHAPRVKLTRLLEHFEREAQIWISLPGHENLVRASAFYVFRSQGDRPFLQMEFVNGYSLGEIMHKQGGFLAAAEAVHCAVGVCQGMKNACDIEQPDQVIIHRDISPDNILLARFRNTPKVSDFGLARLEEEKTLGSIAGKQFYMAPEVLIRGGWLGRVGAAQIDRRADIYSFGVTLYQMLTGTIPIYVRDAWQNAVLSEPPRDIRDTLPPESASVPDELLAVVMGCLEKDPNARIAQTWDALLEQLLNLKKEIDAKIVCDVCNACGFVSRPAANADVCPLCDSHDLVSRTVRPLVDSVASPSSLGLHKIPKVQDPVFLRIPAGRSVVGANMTFIIDIKDRAFAEGIDPNVLAKPKAHAVELAAFEITQTPVTEGQFQRFQQETGYRTNRPGSQGKALDVPVTNVTFEDAEVFCDWAGGRLPRPDEWEKAARGLDGRPFPWGQEFDGQKCACQEAGTAGVVPVDSHPGGRGPFGLLECVGNTAEFVDGGEHGRKYTLGGCFSDMCRYHGLLWARLRFIKPDCGDPTIGFRMAKEVGPFEQFDAQFIRVEGEAVVGCDPSLIAELECRIPLHESVLQDLRRDAQRIVQLQMHEIGMFPVTNEEFWQFAAETGQDYPQHWRRECYAWTSRPFLNRYRYHPVVHVTHETATAYCRWLTAKDYHYDYRLPTREEWQAAARGREPRVYPWGDEYDSTLCNGGEASRQSTVDVREYASGDSPQGCRQMTGNVSEWLAHQDGQTRYTRGGSFDSACELFGMTFFERESNHRSEFASTGFRVVRQRRT